MIPATQSLQLKALSTLALAFRVHVATHLSERLLQEEAAGKGSCNCPQQGLSQSGKKQWDTIVLKIAVYTRIVLLGSVESCVGYIP